LQVTCLSVGHPVEVMTACTKANGILANTHRGNCENRMSPNNSAGLLVMTSDVASASVPDALTGCKSLPKTELKYLISQLIH